MKITKKDLRKTALKLLPAVYSTAMQTGEESGLFQHEDWRTGLCLDAFLLAEAFERAVAYRNTEPEPQLKQLDHSAFDHKYVTNHFYYAAINANGQSVFFSDKPKCNLELGIWYSTAGSTMPMLKGYDASNWRDSLIERDSKELTGSELCKAMLERGDKYVMCFVSGMSDAKADSIPKAITSFNSLTRKFRANHDIWRYAIPINNQGEPLTAAEVGL